MKRQLVENNEVDAGKRLKMCHNTTIDDLPVEILMLIFEKLTATERRNAMMVRKYWLAVVNEHFSHDNCIVLTNNLDYSQDSPLFQTFHDRKLHGQSGRTFPYLLIKSFPYKLSDIMKLSRFVNLFADEVKTLTILHYPILDRPVYFYNETFYLKMPNLEELDVCDASLLGNLAFPEKLKSIDVQNVIDAKIINGTRGLKNCKKEKKITTFRSKSIRMYIHDVYDRFTDPEMMEVLRGIFDKTRSVIVETHFNYCGDSLFSFDDVLSLRFESGVRLLSTENVKPFTKLSSLHMSIHDTEPLINNGNYIGIRSLDLFAMYAPAPSQFEKVLTSFPDCESLVIDGFRLQNEHFTMICQSMPKLQSLMLINGTSSNYISIETLLARGRPSLKNLIHLEKLIIETAELSHPTDELRWPVLPHLQSLVLVGWAFKLFDIEIYSDMSQHCRKLKRVKIDTEGAPCPNSDFTPLLSCHLTHLELPGEGGEIPEHPETNGLLIRNLLIYGRELKLFSIEDSVGLSLEQEIYLFKHMPSLMSVKSRVDYEESPHVVRTMTRDHLCDIKKYLKENLHKYKDVFETIDYMMMHIIPISEVVQMLQTYEKQFNETDIDRQSLEDIRNMYIAAVAYLGLDNIQLCRLAFISSQR